MSRDRNRQPSETARRAGHGTETPDLERGDWNASVNQTGGDRWCQLEQ